MKRKIEGHTKIKCKEKTGDKKGGIIMPHLNNQIWIRTRFVSDNTNLVNCIASFICTYTKYTRVHSK